MKILYRACPYPSQKPLPVDWDKDTLTQRCLYSFMEAGAKDVTFLLDGFKDTSLFEPFGEIIDCTGFGNVGTFQKQLKLAKDYDKVMLVEDDYIWRPNTIPLIEEAIEHLDFVSPYDHPGHYTEDRFDKRYETKLIGNTVYREGPSNTLTFATKKKAWAEMFKFGIADHEMFQHLKEKGLRIWQPTHSFATHMVDGLLAPNVNWTFENPK